MEAPKFEQLTNQALENHLHLQQIMVSTKLPATQPPPSPPPPPHQPHQYESSSSYSMARPRKQSAEATLSGAQLAHIINKARSSIASTTSRKSSATGSGIGIELGQLQQAGGQPNSTLSLASTSSSASSRGLVRNGPFSASGKSQSQSAAGAENSESRRPSGNSVTIRITTEDNVNIDDDELCSSSSTGLDRANANGDKDEFEDRDEGERSK